MVLRPDRARDLLLVDALVVARVGEGDRERAQLVVGLLLGECGDQARVEPSGEVGPDGDVGAQAQPDTLAQELLQVLAGRLTGAVLRRPPRPLLDDAPSLPDDEAAGPDLADPGEHRPRRARAPEREDLVDAEEVRRGGDLSGREQRLRLGAEHERPVAEQGVVEGPHAEAVADERQPARRRLPPGDRELPVEPVERCDAVSLEQAQHDLGVARRVEALAASGELGAQLGVVVDLAVVDEDASAGRGLQGLPARAVGRRSRAATTRARRRPEGDPAAVRAAVADGREHAPKRHLVDRLRCVRTDDPRQPAHRQPGASTTIGGAWRYSVATRRRAISR